MTTRADRVTGFKIAFDRNELGIILKMYGRMVAVGEWRDYGISHLSRSAVFTIYRRTAEHPLFRIEKWPDPAARRGIYLVVDANGQVLRKGTELERVMTYFERRFLRVVK